MEIYVRMKAPGPHGSSFNVVCPVFGSQLFLPLIGPGFIFLLPDFKSAINSFVLSGVKSS